MHQEQIAIEIDGVEAADLYGDLLWVEVETHEDLAALFRFEVAMPALPDGSWAHLDDERLTPWREVRISAGFDDGTEPLMTGYVTHVIPGFEPEPERCRLQVWGMDATVLMDREERLRAWPSMTDSDIAAAVIAEHGLTPHVVSTEVVHDEAVSTVLQRETDAHLLRRLALRNGYECFVDGTDVHFRPRGSDTQLQPTLAVHFGTETNVGRFALEVQGPGPGDVAAFQLHRTEKEVVSAVVDTGGTTALGAQRATDLAAPGMSSARSFLAMTPTTGGPELERLCEVLFERAEWFVTGNGLIEGNTYGAVLRPRRPVTIKGIGDTHSGVYQVTAVTHRIGVDGYVEQFTVRRNGLGLTGSEDFATADGGIGGLG